jgi:hypothetical protein
MGKIIQLVIILALLFFAWQWWQKHHATPAGSSAGGASSDFCTPYVRGATTSWSSGIRNFTAGPPYDTAAWDSFRSDIQNRIHEADSHCSCALESCAKAREAMSGLGDMVNNIDGMIRSNSAPPSDLVQRQENVDNLADQARELASQGK